MIDNAEIEGRIADHLRETAGLTKTELLGGAPLFSSGLIDSVEILNVVMFLESEFCIRIGALDVQMDELDTVQAMAGLVTSKLRAA